MHPDYLGFLVEGDCRSDMADGCSRTRLLLQGRTLMSVLRSSFRKVAGLFLVTR